MLPSGHSFLRQAVGSSKSKSKTRMNARTAAGLTKNNQGSILQLSLRLVCTIVPRLRPPSRLTYSISYLDFTPPVPKQQTTQHLLDTPESTSRQSLRPTPLPNTRTQNKTRHLGAGARAVRGRRDTCSHSTNYFDLKPYCSA